MGLEFLLRRCWHSAPAKRPPFTEIVPVLEELQFPAEWRSLFEQGGVPDGALDDIHQTRALIRLVTDTLDATLNQQHSQASLVPGLNLMESEDFSTPDPAGADCGYDTDSSWGSAEAESVSRGSTTLEGRSTSCLPSTGHLTERPVSGVLGAKSAARLRRSE